MNDRPPIKFISERRDSDIVAGLTESVSTRVTSNSYLAAFLIGTFFTGFLLYLELDRVGFGLFLISWVVLPFLAFSDRIVFDGKRLSRIGILPRIWASISGSRRHLRISDIEQIDTRSVRALKRGGKVYYRYRTTLRGRDTSISISSGSDDYRQMIGRILPLVANSVLDNRSIELRDYLADPKEIRMKAAFARIPDDDVLSASFTRSNRSVKNPVDDDAHVHSTGVEKAEYLHRLGNELRLIGRLHQALESFRRALVLTPKNAWMLFDFARCLHSFAGLQHDRKLGLRSIAALRLAERRAENDGELLARLGEAYFQLGEWHRAGTAFQRSLDIGENFLAARGMAEIALREGKLAHVIHQFAAANRLAESSALRRYSKHEADYFSRLNDDDEYMEVEVGRVNLLESLDGSKRTVLIIASVGFVPILIGLLIEDTIFSDIGWAVTAVALLIWIGLVISVRMLSARIPHNLVESGD